MCRIVEEIVEKERVEERAVTRAELALKMVALNYSYKEISEITEIPVDDIQKLAENLPT